MNWYEDPCGSASGQVPTAAFDLNGNIVVVYGDNVNHKIQSDTFNVTTLSWACGPTPVGQWDVPPTASHSCPSAAWPYSMSPQVGNGCMRQLDAFPYIAIDPLHGTQIVTYTTYGDNPSCPQVNAMRIYRRTPGTTSWSLIATSGCYNNFKSVVAAASTYDQGGFGEHFMVHITGEDGTYSTETDQFVFASHDDGVTWGTGGSGVYVAGPHSWTQPIWSNGYWGDYIGLVYDFNQESYFASWNIENYGATPWEVWVGVQNE